MASSVLKVPQYGKTFEVVGGVALKILNILPARIGVHPVRFDLFTKFKNIEKVLKEDPLSFNGSITANTICQVKSLQDDIPERLWSKIDTAPIVVMHGECDKFGNGYHAYEFYSQIKTRDKELWYYEKMNFGFMLEDEYPDIEKRLVAWLDKHLSLYRERNKSLST